MAAPNLRQYADTLNYKENHKATDVRIAGWYGKPRNYTCDELEGQREVEFSTWTLWSEVYSYRGPHQYVETAKGRRKKFHPFYRFVHRRENEDIMKCCKNPSEGIYMQNHLVGQMCQQASRYIDPDVTGGWGTGAPYSGDVCPPCYREGLEKIIVEQRDILNRDLFAKANEPLFEGAVFLGELGETVASLRSLLVGSLKALTKVKQAKKQLKHTLMNPHEAWLWYRYFLLPAMMDAEDIIAAFTEKQLPIDRIQDGFKKPAWGGYTEGRADTGTVFPYTYEYDFKYRTRVSGGGAIDLLYTHDKSYDFGVSAYDLLRAGWEVTKFSFVFDWIVGIGDWLASWRDVDLTIAQSYSTIVVEGQYEVSDIDNQYWMNEGSSPFKASSYMISRHVDIDPPTTPRFQTEKLSLFRQLDACSLIVGILKGFLAKNRRALTSKQYTE